MATPHDEPVTERSLREAEAAYLAAREDGPGSPSAAQGSSRSNVPYEPAEPVTVRLPRQRPPGQGKHGRALAVAAGVAAVVNTGLAALICLIPLLLIMLFITWSAGQAIGADAVPYALAGWLLAHGVQVRTEIGPLGLTPLSLTILALWRVNRAGVHTTRALGARETGSTAYALLAAGSVGLAYGMLGALAAVIVNRPQIIVEPGPALAKFAVAGTLAALTGSVRATGALRELADATPLVVRDGLRTGVVAALLLIGLGAAGSGLSIALSAGEASELLAAFSTGLTGQAGLTVLCLAFAPNAAVWAASYLLGPGFAVGVGTTVRVGEVDAGRLPPLPMFAGIPDQPLRVADGLLLIVPLLAGIGAGLMLVWRRLRPRRTRRGDTVMPQPHWGRLLSAATISGLVSGFLLAVAAFASAGPLGGGQLSRVGPTPWQVGLTAMAVVWLGGLFGITAGALARQRRVSRSRQSTARG